MKMQRHNCARTISFYHQEAGREACQCSVYQLIVSLHVMATKLEDDILAVALGVRKLSDDDLLNQVAKIETYADWLMEKY